MPVWIIIIVLLSIAVTALLASVLQRLNAPKSRGGSRPSDGGGE